MRSSLKYVVVIGGVSSSSKWKDTQCRARWKEIERGKTKLQRHLREIGRSAPSESVKISFEELESMRRNQDSPDSPVAPVPPVPPTKVITPIEKEVVPTSIPLNTNGSHLSHLSHLGHMGHLSQLSQLSYSAARYDGDDRPGGSGGRRMYFPYRSSCIVGTALFPLCGTEEDDKSSISYTLLHHEPQILVAELPTTAENEWGAHQPSPAAGEEAKLFTIPGVYDAHPILSHSHILSHSCGSFGEFDAGGHDAV
jgi:hypothetical protein